MVTVTRSAVVIAWAKRDGVVGPGAGDRHRPIIGDRDPRDADVARRERLGLTERDLELVDPVPGEIGVAPRGEQPEPVRGGLQRDGARGAPVGRDGGHGGG